MTNATAAIRESLSEGDKKPSVAGLPLTFDVYDDDTAATYIGCRGEEEGA